MERAVLHDHFDEQRRLADGKLERDHAIGALAHDAHVAGGGIEGGGAGHGGACLLVGAPVWANGRLFGERTVPVALDTV